MATIYERVGRNIRDIRHQKGKSQQYVAEKAGLDLTSINEIEMGHRNPSLKTLQKIASALSLKIRGLFDF